MSYCRCHRSKCGDASEPRKSLRSSSWKHRSLGSRRSIRQAIAATDFAHARKRAISAESAARKGEQLGPLHGLPTGIKDLHETAGLLTTYGSPLYRSHVPAHDAAMVALVRKAGAIILCKTNVPEFGAGANTRNLVWGATGNPFDPRLNAGGSSGGSAVALACDMLPVCTGSDTGGSLRIPAAICGAARPHRDCDRAAGRSRPAAHGVYRRFWSVPGECGGTACLPQSDRSHAAPFQHM
jgi:Amidase